MGKCLLLRLLVGFRGVLHPKQVAVFTANFISPPTVGVAIWIARVWSPLTSERRKSVAPSTYVRPHEHKLDTFAPRIGSKIRVRGFESWFSR